MSSSQIFKTKAIHKMPHNLMIWWLNENLYNLLLCLFANDYAYWQITQLK